MDTLKWIEVKERLPKNGQGVITWGNVHGHWMACAATFYEKDSFENSDLKDLCSYNGGFVGSLCEPTHWIELPEPPAPQ